MVSPPVQAPELPVLEPQVQVLLPLELVPLELVLPELALPEQVPPVPPVQPLPPACR